MFDLLLLPGSGIERFDRFHGENMTAQSDPAASRPVTLTEDDAAFLLSVLRDPARVQPITTQQLIDALRTRASR
jgi:hypothetical protein